MKRYILHSFTIFIGILLCFASSCKPDPKPHPNIDKGRYYLGEVKDYLYFKAGSYWIYKNTVTAQLDTITMLKIDTSVAHCDNDLPDAHYFATYTNLVFYQWSSLLKTKFTHSLYPPAAHNFGYNIQRKYIFGGFPETYTSFNFPFVKGMDTTVVYSSGAIYFGTRYNITTGPYHFDSAAMLRVYDESFQPRSTITKLGNWADHYWVKGIGLVKMHVNSFFPETYEDWILTEYVIK